jgi:hypothetical protein
MGSGDSVREVQRRCAKADTSARRAVFMPEFSVYHAGLPERPSFRVKSDPLKALVGAASKLPRKLRVFPAKRFSPTFRGYQPSSAAC